MENKILKNKHIQGFQLLCFVYFHLAQKKIATKSNDF
jgi:hypothetical protein